MLDLAHIRALADKAHAHVCDIAEGKTKWTMRIPADENRDSDLVISNALAVMPAMADEIERLRQRVAELEADPNDVRLPDQAKPLCSDMHTEPRMKGFYLCKLNPGHGGHHMSGDKWWPAAESGEAVRAQ